MVVVRK